MCISAFGEVEHVRIIEVLDKRGPDNQSCTVLLNRISQWKNTSTLWLHGFWSYDWADNYVKVDAVNLTSSTFTVDKQTPPVYGMQCDDSNVTIHHCHKLPFSYTGFKKSARYYALNILEELDSREEV